MDAVTQRRQKHMTERSSEQKGEQTVRDRLNEICLERDLRVSTRLQYIRVLNQLGILDEPLSAVTQELVTERLWRIENGNTRRGSAICCRSVLGYRLKIGKSIPRRYDLPDEDTLRLALMTSPFEVQALAMMYCALRLGEACALTCRDLSGDRLRIDKQVQCLRETGHPTITRVAPTKTAAADVIVPHWLVPRIETLTATVRPDPVRESLRRAGKRVGISLNPHQLRAWCITEMIARQVPLELVRKQARHSDIAMTLTYYQEYKDSIIQDVFS